MADSDTSSDNQEQQNSLLDSELLKLLSAAKEVGVEAYETAKANVKQLVEDPEAYAKRLEENIKTQTKDPANFIGGGAGTIRGVLAKNWDAKAATKAVDLMIAKENPGNIWRETGTYHNPVDKKLRQEISDLPAKLKIDPKTSEESMFRLKDVLHHPELLDAYPKQLKDLDVSFKPGEKGGVFYKGTRVLDPLVEVGTANEDILSVLLHEVQHVIQKAEGFASGANLKTAEAYLEKQASKLQSAERLKETKSTELSPSAIAALDKQINELKQNLTPDLGNSLRRLTPEEATYLRSAGENEAFVVQNRLKMTDEERRIIPPFSSESMNVPWSRQILDMLK